MYKVSASYPFDIEQFFQFSNPDPVLSFENPLIDNVDVHNPSFDYVPPELIQLYVTNMLVITILVIRSNQFTGDLILRLIFITWSPNATLQKKISFKLLLYYKMYV